MYTFILSILIFSIIHLTPGDPARIMLGADASQEEVDALTERLGLNEPLIKQYGDWMGGVYMVTLVYHIQEMVLLQKRLSSLWDQR